MKDLAQKSFQRSLQDLQKKESLKDSYLLPEEGAKWSNCDTGCVSIDMIVQVPIEIPYSLII